MSAFSVTSTVNSYPTHPYREIKEAILGKKYELSLVFIGQKRAATINKTYRNKLYSPNVLSFPLSDTTGEICICPIVAKKEAHAFGLSTKGYVAFLFIHGCLHLKGLDHGDTMDAQEKKYLKKFSLS